MAKEDFCFTYYDGDATREMAHMSRLERGAYTDIIIQQRQRGHLTKNDIQKFLSKDFEQVWDAIVWVLKIDEEGKYFIEWLENSIIKSRKHSQKQKGNRFGGTKLDFGGTKPSPNDDQTSVLVVPKSILVGPLKDGNGNEDIREEEWGVGEIKPVVDITARKNLLVPTVIEIFKKENSDYFEDFVKDAPAALKIYNDIARSENFDPSNLTQEQRTNVMRRWGEITKFVVSHDHFKNYNLSQIEKYFQSIIQSEKNGSKIIKSPGRTIVFDTA